MLDPHPFILKFRQKMELGCREGEWKSAGKAGSLLPKGGKKSKVPEKLERARKEPYSDEYYHVEGISRGSV
jgi:hypothetical protein